MQLIGYNMLDVRRLRALQLSSRHRYIARNGPFYVAFWRFTTQPINLQLFVKLCYAVIAHIAFHLYLTTYLLLLYANLQRFISYGWCSKLKRVTVLSKGKAFNFYEPIGCFGMSILLNKLLTLRKKHLFSGQILIFKAVITIIVMITNNKISFLFKIYKTYKNWRILGLALGLKPTNLNT